MRLLLRKLLNNLKAIRKEKINKFIIEQLNVSSLRNKFDCLVQQITKHVDSFMVSETKLDNSFLGGQFY